MFRRQFRHLNTEKDSESLGYREVFLDMNGYDPKYLDFQINFHDTNFTDNAPEEFLKELGKF